MFKKALKSKARLRLCIQGGAGFGKSFTSLKLATNMCGEGKRVAVLDSEYGSAEKYAHLFDFDVMTQNGSYHPDRFVEAIKAAEADGGYDCFICDSLSAFWADEGGILDIVKKEEANMRARGMKGDGQAAWKVGDDLYKKIVHAIMGSKMHIFVTLRAKQEYARSEGANGKTKIERLGLAPVFRNEFNHVADLEAMMTADNQMVVGKSRVDTIPPGTVIDKPGVELANLLKAWLDGAPPPPARDWEAELRACTTKAELQAVAGEARRLLGDTAAKAYVPLFTELSKGMQ